MQITNPLNTKIAVQIKGVVYEIEGGDTIYNIPEDIARDWQEKTHQFIILRKDKIEDKKVETIEIPTPKVEEVPVVEDVVETTPEVEITPEPVVEETPVVETKSKGKGKTKSK